MKHNINKNNRNNNKERTSDHIDQNESDGGKKL